MPKHSKARSQKPRRPMVKSDSLSIKVHTQVTLNLDTVNLRRVDIAILPNNFDMLLRYAALYQRYRIDSGSWRFYCSRVVNAIQTPALPIYPLLVYEVPLTTSSVP